MDAERTGIWNRSVVSSCGYSIAEPECKSGDPQSGH